MGLSKTVLIRNHCYRKTPFNIYDLIFDFSETKLTLDPCDPNPCHPGVLCLTTWNGNETKFECGLCPDGMIGDGLNCTYTNPCWSSPCSFPLKCQPSMYKVCKSVLLFLSSTALTVSLELLR